jgi:DNA processing protein
LITARFALEQNRDVLAIPGSIYNPGVRGCHYLLQQGAKLVMSSDDILDELGLGVRSQTSYPEPQAVTTSPSWVTCIGFEVTSVDQMIQRSGLDVDAIIGDLADLELQGIIKAVPGGYVRCSL